MSTGGFQAEVDDVTLSGDVTTGLLGFDAEWKRLLAGVLVAGATATAPTACRVATTRAGSKRP